jgi:hypothetical protein
MKSIMGGAAKVRTTVGGYDEKILIDTNSSMH